MSHVHLPIDFATPQALWLLLTLPFWWVLRAWRRPPTITFSRADLISHGPKAGRVYPILLFLLRNLLLIAMVVTLARPHTPKHDNQVTTRGINIMLAVDLSSSMLAQDFQPRNRMEVAKSSVRQFILARPSDRIGLVAFASEAVTQVPLTTDYPILLQAVDNLQIGQLNDGTAIGDGIAAAANRLRNAPGKSHVVILLTDGVNNRGIIDPLTAAKAAAAYGIKVYTIGVGTKGVAPVPVGMNPEGTLRFAWQPVQIDEALLTQVSQITGGRYFRATDAAALDRIYQQINILERSTIRATTYVRFTELYRWSLGAALLLLFLEIGLSAVRAPLP